MFILANCPTPADGGVYTNVDNHNDCTPMPLYDFYGGLSLDILIGSVCL